VAEPAVLHVEALEHGRIELLAGAVAGLAVSVAACPAGRASVPNDGGDLDRAAKSRPPAKIPEKFLELRAEA
jgi:hypothetical protein